MSVFNHVEFDNHEQVAFCNDSKSGLQAIVAIHNTSRGAALGGCRMWPYQSSDEALNDVLRLSKGMTYKSALANLAMGGGKSVIIGDPRKDKTPALLMAFGDFIDNLSGRYITAEDSGTCVQDMLTIGQRTRHISGVDPKQKNHGDPSPSTAYGTFVSVKATAKKRFGSADLQGLTIAVQGLGNVGFNLAQQLNAAGAILIVCDIFEGNLERARQELNCTVVAPDEIYASNADIFAPCAMGGIVNDQSIKQFKFAAIVGAANNQLATAEHGHLLAEKGILYAPDYVVNAGGVIDIEYQRIGLDDAAMNAHLDSIGDTLDEIFARAEVENCSTHRIANLLAEERF